MTFKYFLKVLSKKNKLHKETYRVIIFLKFKTCLQYYTRHMYINIHSINAWEWQTPIWRGCYF